MLKFWLTVTHMETTLTVNVYTILSISMLEFWLTVTHMETTLRADVCTSSLYLYAKVLANCHTLYITRGNHTDSEYVYQLCLSLCKSFGSLLHTVQHTLKPH